MADSNQSDPLGEMSDEEFQALTPQQKGARTRQANAIEHDDPTGETAQMMADHTERVLSDEAALGADDLNQLQPGDERVQWITIGADGKPIT